MKLFGNLFQKSAASPKNEALEAHQLLFSLVMMAWFVEAKDPYSGGHLWRVSQYAKLLAQAIGHLELPRFSALSVIRHSFLRVQRIVLGKFDDVVSPYSAALWPFGPACVMQ
jgi:hypothetical protein